MANSTSSLEKRQPWYFKPLRYVDRDERKRVVPLEVLNLSMMRTGSMCMSFILSFFHRGASSMLYLITYVILCPDLIYIPTLVVCSMHNPLPELNAYYSIRVISKPRSNPSLGNAMCPRNPRDPLLPHERSPRPPQRRPALVRSTGRQVLRQRQAVRPRRVGQAGRRVRRAERHSGARVRGKPGRGVPGGEGNTR